MDLLSFANFELNTFFLEVASLIFSFLVIKILIGHVAARQSLCVLCTDQIRVLFFNPDLHPYVSVPFGPGPPAPSHCSVSCLHLFLASLLMASWMTLKSNFKCICGFVSIFLCRVLFRCQFMVSVFLKLKSSSLLKMSIQCLLEKNMDSAPFWQKALCMSPKTFGIYCQSSHYFPVDFSTQMISRWKWGLEISCRIIILIYISSVLSGLALYI